MKKFEFDVIIIAPSKEDAEQKIKALNTIGSKLSLKELLILAETVNNPTALALAKKNLGI